MSFLAACVTTEYIEVPVSVPKELRTPQTVEPREVTGFKDVGLVLTNYIEANEVNVGKIRATDCILTAAEEGQEEFTCPAGPQ